MRLLSAVVVDEMSGTEYSVGERMGQLVVELWLLPGLQESSDALVSNLIEH